MKNRIFKILKWSGLNLSQFADALKVSPALLSSVKSERTKPTLLLVENIKRLYPEIDINWLITGEGDMLMGASGDKHLTADPTEDEMRQPFSKSHVAPEEIGEFAMMVENERHSVERPVIPEQEVASPVRREVAPAVETSQQGGGGEPAVPPVKDGQPLRTVKQVLLMYNDGTYESFEKH